MWEWSRTVAERAAAAVWTRQAGEPQPTVVDPEEWRDSADHNDDMPGPVAIGEYCLIG
ncbi:hypothetical protein BJY24_003705 [Nocardia transvalensis]|uniref:Uncharacterized protein n=1 Tax=Nocardia transvalensis TaxID=37333 RepID=A0A7W9UIW5_9NOCA|nr:hypothetical protein [Nocardia transvalensis]MBB5914838.1 hypothetical protein [Nocardia transvalensis]